MSLLNSVRENIYQGNISKIKPRHLMLAYIQFHIENQSLHPDEVLGDGGYPGWAVLLIGRVCNIKNLTDEFEYPCAFAKLDDTLTKLMYFHEDCLEDNDDENIPFHEDLLEIISNTKLWLDEFEPSELVTIVDGLQKLYLYHASENDTAEEEAEKPAGVIKTCADVLNFIMTRR